MEPEIILNISGGGEEPRRVAARPGETLLEALRRGGVELAAPCGGHGTCGQCKVRVNGTVLLACRTAAAEGMTISLPERAAGERVLTDAAVLPAGGSGLGFAVDIGTTTVAAYLYDLESGRCLGSRGEMNAQRSYGADVISRIGHAKTPEGLAALTAAIRGQLQSMAGALCPAPEKIRYVSIAGNTVMQHLFAGLSPESIGVAPFRPLSLFGEERSAAEFLEGFAPDCRLYLCPCVAGYVGGDITAGLFSSGASEAEGLTLFIDVGTNGEMGLGGREGFLCCATAAGPAFEGAEIACGSPARDGAVNLVEPDLSYTVLGGTEPRSICGSGLVDAVAALLGREEIDESGRLETDPYPIAGPVYLSGRDVRQLQLAKAAIRAGVETLLEREGKRYEDVDEVLIAGGFGAYLRLKSACAIGMLPPALLEKTRHVGNSAGRGAALALTAGGREALARLRERCRYEELSSSPLFNGHYIDAMMFDEWEEV
ncbi:MAG: DUF4445 domain-containing protein [Oscillospiraceae bacterium]|nr:DUF4445 domain-containing protein [Oscillospiraceae bacterium]